MRGLSPLDALAAVTEEIASPEKLLPAGLVENDGGIGGIDHPHADLEREIGLDQAGEDVAIRPLSRQHKMNVCGTAFRREPDNERFELLLLLLPRRDESRELAEGEDLVRDVRHLLFEQVCLRVEPPCSFVEQITLPTPFQARSVQAQDVPRVLRHPATSFRPRWRLPMGDKTVRHSP